jgi:ferredoxin
MAHLAARSAYQQLSERINRGPQGAPPEELLYRILALLFTPRQAELVAALPIRGFTAAVAAQRWQLPAAEAQRQLDALADKALLLDYEQEGDTHYVLPPPMAGFFEFSMMRVRGDVDQKLLAELFHEYINVEEGFVTALFGRGETKLGRVFVREDSIPVELSLQVLDHERASCAVREAFALAVGTCYCRHKMLHVGHACDAPLEICMTLNTTASSLARHGFARAIDAAEGLDLLQQARERGLVQFGDNVRQRVAFLCNCCGCCCEAMIAARRLGFLHPVHTTSYIACVDAAACSGCGQCLKACPVAALSLISAGDPERPKKQVAVRDEQACLGCGVCVRSCARGGLRLVARPVRVIPPLNTAHRVVLMAIERGKLHELVLDNQAGLAYRAMAAILGVVLRLPPLKQALASQQFRSRYLEALLARQ